MRKILALKLRQWFPEWDLVKFDDPKHGSGTRREPPHHFYVLKMPARELLRLSGTQRRSVDGRSIGKIETGIQRRHDRKRSLEITEYLKFGFPYAQFRPQDRSRSDSVDARMPGWLPTAIVINILDPKFPDKRKGQCVADEDHIRIEDLPNEMATLYLPEEFDSSSWNPQALPPIEIIDGQHRLLAFDDSGSPEDYDLPVVAFHGMDLTWQAYLFYIINIRPVRINTSLAFDLYPLLRTERWLEINQGPLVYRETRAQEIVQALYSHPKSPWLKWINMLGEPGLSMVRQAAWIRSLLATYVKSPSGSRVSIGGLFGSRVSHPDEFINWDGAQQVAFIMYLGNVLRDLIRDAFPSWAEEIRDIESETGSEDADPAFYGRYSLLNTDQGIRGLLSITNDLCFMKMEELRLWEWTPKDFGGTYDACVITSAYESLSKHQPITDFFSELMDVLVDFDWRTSSAPGLKEQERTIKLTFRGSSGYREIRRRLLIHLEQSSSPLSEWSSEVIDRLRLPRE